MSNIRFGFEFRRVNKPSDGLLAFMEVTVFADNLPLVTSRGWAVRNGPSGIWFAPPTREFQAADGKKAYARQIGFGGMEKEGNHWRQQFEKAAHDAYSRQGGQPAPTAGSPMDLSFAPAPRAPGVQLPPGWTSSVDTQTKKTYYISPQGLTQWDPPVAAAPVAPPPPAPPRMTPPANPGYNNPFADVPPSTSPFGDAGPYPEAE